MTTTLRPICFDCIHFDTVGNLGDSCSAYPEGIPEEIFRSIADHRRPYRDDGGIRFEPVDGSKLTGDPDQIIPWLGAFQPRQEAEEGGG